NPSSSRRATTMDMQFGLIRPLLMTAALALGVGTWPYATGAAETVDCGLPGQTVGKKMPATAKGLDIIVKGACVENLVIERDDVVLRHDGLAPASISAADPSKPAVLLDGAHRTMIDGVIPGGFRISGGTNGISVSRSSTLDIANCVIEGNTGSGLIASYGSTVSIDSCAIQYNIGQGA